MSFIGYRELYNALFWTSNDVYQRPQVNTDLIQRMVGGVIICDEIHNVYNYDEHNTWGSAVVFLSLYLQDAAHFLYMTATPLNHPEEASSLLQLMLYRNSKPDSFSAAKRLIV